MKYIAIDNGQNIIDSRDIIAYIAELEGDRADLVDAVTSAKETLSDAMDDTSALCPEELDEQKMAVEEAETDLELWDSENQELKALQALAEEAEGCGDWRYGEPLIRDSYFERYAMELADDMGAISRDASWPCNCIDWEKAVEQLQQDYTSVNYDNVIYWIRS